MLEIVHVVHRQQQFFIKMLQSYLNTCLSCVVNNVSWLTTKGAVNGKLFLGGEGSGMSLYMKCECFIDSPIFLTLV